MDINGVPCMKCGRHIAPGNVFCPECLADMAQHPVKPGTPIQIPTPPPMTQKKTSARRVRKPEDQIRRLRAAVVWLSILLAVVIALSGIVISMLYHRLDANQPGYRPGENYNTTETSTNTDQLFHMKQFIDECFT